MMGACHRFRMDDTATSLEMAVGQNPVPLVNSKIDGSSTTKWSRRLCPMAKLNMSLASTFYA